jgi:hypothetical protein
VLPLAAVNLAAATAPARTLVTLAPAVLMLLPCFIQFFVLLLLLLLLLPC